MIHNQSLREIAEIQWRARCEQERRDRKRFFEGVAFSCAVGLFLWTLGWWVAGWLIHSQAGAHWLSLLD